ncbi:hypothetical protein LY474_14685 [Myxococcus stipitatus]|uniref:hypothetical protein n=1 Tax=Myxococcus stipitatus TaxID=83455 RepID=UPI001F1DF9A3|nr:hypothetical protein [Myxococcus stipitatus]MCE9669056.1 hypothetical protein [Myxococcus stipitatus]
MNLMPWRNLDEMLSGLDIPAGCTAEQLAREDIPRLTALLRSWYPDIQVGTESRHLEPSFYEREFFLRGESPDRNLYGIVCRAKESGDIIGLLSLEKNVRGLQLSAVMGVVEPSKRGLGIGHIGSAALVVVGRNIGAEVVLYYSTLKTARAQRNAEGQGFKLVGLVPAFDVDAIAPNTVKRVYEALYAQVLVGPERIHVPDWNELIPSTRALFTHLFGESKPQGNVVVASSSVGLGGGREQLHG